MNALPDRSFSSRKIKRGDRIPAPIGTVEKEPSESILDPGAKSLSSSDSDFVNGCAQFLEGGRSRQNTSVLRAERKRRLGLAVVAMLAYGGAEPGAHFSDVPQRISSISGVHLAGEIEECLPLRSFRCRLILTLDGHITSDRELQSSRSYHHVFRRRFSSDESPTAPSQGRL